MARVERTHRDSSPKNRKKHMMSLIVAQDMVGRIIPKPFLPKVSTPYSPEPVTMLLYMAKRFADVIRAKGLEMGRLFRIIWGEPMESLTMGEKTEE